MGTVFFLEWRKCYEIEWWCLYNSINLLKNNLVVPLKWMNFIVCKWYFTKAVKQQQCLPASTPQRSTRVQDWLPAVSIPISSPGQSSSQLRFSLGCTWKYRTLKDTGAQSISWWKHLGKVPLSESPRADSLTKKGALEFSSRESPPYPHLLFQRTNTAAHRKGFPALLLLFKGNIYPPVPSPFL